MGNDENDDNGSRLRRCSYCGLPPKVPGKKLRRCSRCHNVWYHDAECQKRHFPLHKTDCQRWHKERNVRVATAVVATGCDKGNDNGNDNGEPTTTTRASGVTPKPKQRKAKPKPKRSPQFVVEHREGRGKCLVASGTPCPATDDDGESTTSISARMRNSISISISIRKGDWIRDPETNRDDWDPLVLPVLLEEHRTSRCALCFGRLSDHSCEFPNPKSPLYRLFFCSTVCRAEAGRRGMDREERDAHAFWTKSNGRGPPRIFATVILLYRILVTEQQQTQTQQTRNSNPSVLNQLHDLQSKPRREAPDTTERETPGGTDETFSSPSLASGYHTRGVIATAMGLLQQSSDAPMLAGCRPSIEHLVDTVHRIKVNGFSITDGEDLERIGIGLYGLPSFLNHSCSPSALQTFSLAAGTGRPPVLRVAAVRDIPLGHEICISYTDASCPSRLRKKRLEEDYFFVCGCEACDVRSERQDDCATLALRCPSGCCHRSSATRWFRSTVVRVDNDNDEESDPRPRYRCTECHRTDFDTVLRKIGEFESELLLQFGASSNTKSDEHERRLRTAYRSLRKLCHTGSWYVQEAGDRLLQHYLGQLPELADNPANEHAKATTALEIAEELLPSESELLLSFRNTNTSAFLKRQLLRYKAAKLRLFLVPDPRRSIRELEQVLSALQPCFAPDHALIVGLKGCLANARM